MISIRPVCEQDLAGIAEIQAAVPEASQWDPHDYLNYECRVAEQAGRVMGFLVCRRTDPGEAEILNLAVAPALRRQGVGRQLLDAFLASHPGNVFLEVRESNQPARRFYERLGFELVTKRLRYYNDPVESAIVMKLYSW
jgi:ribosomal-protein-alanine N-acetyltransferase